jgi:hypothetical protein
MNAVSSGLSTLALALPRICTLSTLYAYSYVSNSIRQGVSTASSFISTLWTSTLIVNFMNLNSTVVSSVVTSSFRASDVNSFSMGQSAFSFFRASSVNVEQSYVSSFSIGLQTSTLSTVSLTYGILNTQTLLTDHFYASSVNANIVTGGTVYLKDNAASGPAITYALVMPALIQAISVVMQSGKGDDFDEAISSRLWYQSLDAAIQGLKDKGADISDQSLPYDVAHLIMKGNLGLSDALIKIPQSVLTDNE